MTTASASAPCFSSARAASLERRGLDVGEHHAHAGSRAAPRQRAADAARPRPSPPRCVPSSCMRRPSVEARSLPARRAPDQVMLGSFAKPISESSWLPRRGRGPAARCRACRRRCAAPGSSARRPAASRVTSSATRERRRLDVARVAEVADLVAGRAERRAAVRVEDQHERAGRRRVVAAPAELAAAVGRVVDECRRRRASRRRARRSPPAC